MVRLPTGVDDVTIVGVIGTVTSHSSLAEETGSPMRHWVRTAACESSTPRSMTATTTASDGLGRRLQYVIESGIFAYSNGASGVGSVESVSCSQRLPEMWLGSNGTSNFGGAGISSYSTYTGNVGSAPGTADNSRATARGRSLSALPATWQRAEATTASTCQVITLRQLQTWWTPCDPRHCGSGGDWRHGLELARRWLATRSNQPAIRASGWTTRRPLRWLATRSRVPRTTAFIWTRPTLTARWSATSPKQAGWMGSGCRRQPILLSLETCRQTTQATVSRLPTARQPRLSGTASPATPLGIQETGTSDNNLVAGVSSTGNTSDTSIFANDASMAVASKLGGTRTLTAASTLDLHDYCDYFVMSGATAVDNIEASYAGRVVTIRSDGNTTINDGGNLRLSGNLSLSDLDCVILVCDGTNWYQCAVISNNQPP